MTALVSSRTLKRLSLALPLAVVTATGSLAQTATPPTHVRIVSDGGTRIVDPKLADGTASFAFHLEPTGVAVSATAKVLKDGVVLDTLWSGQLVGGASATQIVWEGRDSTGVRCDTGHYTVRVSGIGATRLDLPLDVVRLGVTEIEAQDTPAGDDEYQMVYFKKGGAISYYATPAIHEYANLARAGEVSPLDFDDGEPRPAVGVHDATAAPVLDGGDYDQFTFNYPWSYIMGAQPRLELTFGDAGTTAAGEAMGAGYPVAGYDIRAVVTGSGTSTTDPILPGGQAVIDLAALPAEVTRVDLDLGIRWEYSAHGSPDWDEIPGSTTIPARIYTILDVPLWKAGATGTRYTGPWVEVAEYVSSWGATLGMAAYDETSLTEVFIQGFFGQNGGIPTAIEGVIYDAYPLGGDGGTTHYFNWSGWRMDISALLNNHSKGVYVNCTDNMGASSTMLSMLGVERMRPMRLGTMNLKAIWGIGAPAYTTNLWGGGGHSFSYHHIVTNDDAVTVSDTCMQLDEDGNPESTPGIPGWNHHRLWKGVGGYNQLSSSNNTSWNLETLPGIK